MRYACKCMILYVHMYDIGAFQSSIVINEAYQCFEALTLVLPPLRGVIRIRSTDDGGSGENLYHMVAYLMLDTLFTIP